eukprot:gene13459-30931_t
MPRKAATSSSRKRPAADASTAKAAKTVKVGGKVDSSKKKRSKTAVAKGKTTAATPQPKGLVDVAELEARVKADPRSVHRLCTTYLACGSTL